ncbi:MAG TPA: hypothetical protein VET23_07715 [Chitinophagaceae bacterium]|nr:hypothetical protein [Chitinophagaceae bacterium]
MAKRSLFLGIIVISFSIPGFSQHEGDTLLKRCPVYITDTSGYNNYFLEFQPSKITVDKSKGELSVIVTQKDQYFSLFFGKKHLENKKYRIEANADSKNEVAAKYSFRSDDQVSYVVVTSGTVECNFNKDTKLWNIKVNGLLSNYVGRSTSYFKVRADFYIR